MNQLMIAHEFARVGHYNQFDESGEDYYTGHLLRVENQVDGDNEKIVAILHDILNTSIISYEDLYTSFGKEIANTIKLLTKQPPEIYEQYISRIVHSGNKLAIKIKLADIKDHLRDTRSLSQSMIDRSWASYKKIENALEKYVERN